MEASSTQRAGKVEGALASMAPAARAPAFAGVQLPELQPSALFASSDLRHVDLGGAELGAAGVGKLAVTLTACSPDVRATIGIVTVSASGATDQGTELSGVVALAAALRTLPHLRALVVADNHLGGPGAAALLGPPRPLAPHLELLDVSLNEVGPSGAAALAAALDAAPAATAGGPHHHARRLAFVDASKNKLGDTKGAGGVSHSAGVPALVRALLHPPLAYLDLSGNALGRAAGAIAALAAALPSVAGSLRELHLESNGLSGADAKALAAGVRAAAAAAEAGVGAVPGASACVLAVLDLRHNHVGSRGAAALAALAHAPLEPVMDAAAAHKRESECAASGAAPVSATTARGERDSHVGGDVPDGAADGAAQAAAAAPAEAPPRRFALAAALPSLRLLDLRDNFVSAAGAALVAAALGPPPTMPRDAGAALPPAFAAEAAEASAADAELDAAEAVAAEWGAPRADDEAAPSPPQPQASSAAAAPPDAAADDADDDDGATVGAARRRHTVSATSASTIAGSGAAAGALRLVRASLRVGRDGRITAVTELRGDAAAGDDGAAAAAANVVYERAVLLDVDSVETLLPHGADAADELATAEA